MSSVKSPALTSSDQEALQSAVIEVCENAYFVFVEPCDAPQFATLVEEVHAGDGRESSGRWLNASVAFHGARSGQVSTGPRIQMQIVLAGTRRLNVLANFPPDARWFEPNFAPGSHPLVTPPLPMSVTEYDTSDPGTAIRQFDVGEGTWTFTEAGTTAGAEIEGSFEATLYRIPPAP